MKNRTVYEDWLKSEKIYTTWWQRMLLWFKRPIITCGYDLASGPDYGVRVHYKWLKGELHVTKIEYIDLPKMDGGA